MSNISEKIKEDLPNFVLNMKPLFLNELDEFINSYDKKYQKSIRLNSKKIDRKFLENAGILLKENELVKDTYFVEDENLTKHPYYHLGLYYFQELSASVPISYFSFDENAKVLDMCSAPGGKSLQISAKLSDKGVLFSNDISVSRQRATVKNIEKFGISNSIIMAENLQKLTKYYRDFFDAILVDAPCSGEGMFAKDKSLMNNWDADKIEEYSNRQLEILDSARLLLKKGGSIMYSTCTFDVRENEGVIERFLSAHNDFEVILIDNDLADGLGKFDDKIINASNRILPHKHDALGHFFIVLKKNGELNTDSEKKIFNEPPDYFKSFSKSIGFKPKKGYYFEKNDKLYYTFYKIDVASNCRILRTGLLLGELKGIKFIPSQAFAMSLNIEDVKNKIEFSLEDENAIKYLKGETLMLKKDKGYYLIFIDSMSAGFALSDGIKLKNKLKKDWILV